MTIYRHYIFLADSYTKRTRVAHDIITKEGEPCPQEQTLRNRLIKLSATPVSFAVHSISYESKDWQTFQQAFPFFRNTKLIKDEDEFVEILRNEQSLRAVDVASYILATQKCTQYRLHKLVYLCYAEYLCQTNKNLFTDKIYAFERGPVIDSLYQIFKGQYNINQQTILKYTTPQWAPKSRIVWCENGLEKFACIDKVVNKYKDYTTDELIELTHHKNSPWQMSYSGKKYQEISDKIIKEYHKYDV